ncbi:MAG TPA: maleylacetoacetate isomerase [Gammaproteobacteria bacterium]|nr:maleylacetoacetate isomerase [Gammaproteobacteria bacterium]
MFVLHGYWRSSASYRVRIALNLKGLAYDYRPVHLVRGGGEQHAQAFRARNPHGLVPVLEVDGHVLTQSLAIVEFLEERYPLPPLLPADPFRRAWIRGVADAIACEIHPLDNLRVLQYLTQTLGAAETAKNEWYRHWVHVGFRGIERELESMDEPFSLGDTPGLLEAFLVPQVYNARRFECDLSDYPRIRELDARCTPLAAFRDAAPENQPDASA